MKDIRLLINNKEADLDDNSVIALTVTLEDTDNPTVVKNTYTKSVTLPATGKNNTIFGSMHRIDARVGSAFSPIVRTPFKLLVNGDVYMSGYAQLTEVSVKKGRTSYKVSLFGGLGDFFYSLAYKEDGEKKTLADLVYNVAGASSAEEELDFDITKEEVLGAWDNIDGVYDDRHAIINFVPAYNGVAKDFDGEHALINHNEFPVSLPKTDGNYGVYNGYALAKFPRAISEWEARDLRSYCQRPALTVRGLFRAICNDANNGGYEVELDPTFFNEENPVYHDAFITLPMLGSEGEEKEGETKIVDIAFRNGQTSAQNNYFFISRSVRLPEGLDGTSVKVSIPMSFSIQPSVTDVDELYDSTRGTTLNYASSFIIAQAVAYTDNTKATCITRTPEYIFSFKPSDFEVDSVKGYSPLYSSSDERVKVKGSYKRVNSTTYYFTDKEGNNTFPLEMSFLQQKHRNVFIELKMQRCYRANVQLTQNIDYYWPLPTVGEREILTLGQTYKSNNSIEISNARVTLTAEDIPAVASGARITKAMLLATEASPTDYLLSYTKLFGLRFIRDKYDKKITITQNYFTGDVVNIQERIDYSGDIKIVTNTFSKKIMRLALDTPDTYFTKKYKDAHGADYAQKRIDTGYEFNSDTEDVYKSNVYKSAVPCRGVSQLYYNMYTSEGKSVPPPLSLGIEYHLTEGESVATANKLTTHATSISSSVMIDSTKAVPYFATKGYDALPKMCYYDMDGEEHKEVDISNNLVIYCGKKAPQDANGNAIDYWLTDDVNEMIKFNGKPCYLLTASEESVGGDSIAIKLSHIPQFLSIRLYGSEVIRGSFEFAKSKENYLGEDIVYQDNETLYGKYWSDYYSDRLNVDTKIVECMVDFTGMVVDDSINRHFYYFENSLWLLNKVSDYNPDKGGLTKCQFIKVNDRSSYINTDR